MQTTLIETIGIAAGLLTSVSFIPQLIKTVRTKKADDVSVFMLITRGVGLALWVIYGLMKSDIPVLATFSLSFVINAAVTFFKIKYSLKK
jgi:MtN3 and saliva related transmembrane protein